MEVPTEEPHEYTTEEFQTVEDKLHDVREYHPGNASPEATTAAETLVTTVRKAPRPLTWPPRPQSVHETTRE